MTSFLGALGTEILAAHQIVLQTMIVIFMVPLAMSHATTVRVGQWIGKRNCQAAKQAGYLSLGLSGFFMAITAIAL